MNFEIKISFENFEFFKKKKRFINIFRKFSKMKKK